MSEISGAVEGSVDEAVLRRLVREAGGTVGKVFGLRGKGHLLQQIGAYNHAARFSSWVVLMDFDSEIQCVPSYVSRVLPDPSPRICFRLAVRAIESWLLADRERFAAFFSIGVARIPRNPDDLPDPKLALVNLARHSRRREVRENLVPRPESGRSVGPGYTSWITEYVQNATSGWRPPTASESSDSLVRCRACIRHLISIQ
jgi:hypothetical protein